MPQPSKLRFGVVRVVGRDIAVTWGPRLARGTGGFGGFCSPFSPWEMELDCRRWNVSDSYEKTWQHFRSANVSLESSIRALFGDVFGFNINVGVYEKFAKRNDYSAKTQMLPANSCCPCCDNTLCRRRQRPPADSWMNVSGAPPMARTVFWLATHAGSQGSRICVL